MKALLLALLLAQPAAAGTLSDAIFAPHAVAGPEVWRFDDGTARDLRLEPQGDRIAMTLDGAPVSDFGAGSAAPAMIWFLEGVVRDMAEATGGSPFYIRNRIREALAASDTPEVVPFAADPNRDKMGAFADLALRFDLREGRLFSLSADGGTGADGYHRSLTRKE